MFTQTIRLLIFAALVTFAAASACAQSDDPSEIFLKAYMTAQQGEKLEHDGQLGGALAKFRFAGSLLEELKKQHAEWQPAIVEYRGRKIGESILRIQSKTGTQQDLATATASSGSAAEPNVEINTHTTPPVSAAGPPDEAAIKNATRDLRDKVDQLQSELEKSREQFAAAQKEREGLVERLSDTSGKLQRAEGDLQKSQGAEKQARDQLTSAQDSLSKIQASGKPDTKAQEALKAEVAELKKALATAEAGRSAAEKERIAAASKVEEANKQIATIKAEKDATVRERDELLAQLKMGGEAQQRVQALVTENSELKGKLANAEKTVREISEDKPKKEQEIADVKRQLDGLRQQLVTSQKQNQDYEVTIADLRSQLDDAGSELDKAKLTGTNSEETARLTQENEMLRGIVTRERQQDARREQAKKLMVAELDKLKVKSQTLNQQVELLAQPVMKLSDAELALLRKPVVAISDNNPAALKASFTAPKQSGPDAPAKPEAAAEKLPAAATKEVGAPGPAVVTAFKPEVPDPLLPVARQAKESFDRGKFRQAEKQYEEILAKSPNNLYALSNLGVVLFRNGKLKAAEQTLKKALAVGPNDEFSHTTIGIVYYREGKYDEALAELTKSLAINPKSATAHNYLGITASQKGWQEAAEKELLQAVEDNPDYADAHFNLSVVYATANPPSKELAKRHYSKATSLGAEPDPELEKMLN